MPTSTSTMAMATPWRDRRSLKDAGTGATCVSHLTDRPGAPYFTQIARSSLANSSGRQRRRTCTATMNNSASSMQPASANARGNASAEMRRLAAMLRRRRSAHMPKAPRPNSTVIGS
eukprot:CAMPEP_0176177498 /NCGR_PEP_ID=MMETSP0120_2-20121206/90930_1 /TAXON_ID=160619 /ORGANISM="Kryptoperidinium foliaceum, Strain CCMP 1326" /LENGTH=116 /DNA_ID=CAMNT_0017515593 /DNA_START=56 /DNA_END=403 /DNA_ORIENTATION=-